MFAANAIQHQSSGGPSNFGGTLWGYGESFAASVEVIFNTNGSIVGVVTDYSITDTINGDNWFAPNQTGIGSSYWIRATVVSGSITTGSPTGSWLSMSSTTSWTVFRFGAGSANAQLFIEISSSGTGSPVVASGTVNLTAQVAITPP